MPSERVVTGAATLLFAGLSVFAWRDYLAATGDAYDARDSARDEVASIDAKLRTAVDFDTVEQLTLDRNAADLRYQQGRRRVNEIDGWDSLEWKVKNTVRLAAPAATALCAAFTLLSITTPLRRDG